MLRSRIGEGVVTAPQLKRQKEDVFPAFDRLNNLTAIAPAFPAPRFRNCSKVFSFEPQYHSGSPVIYRFFQRVHAVLPGSMTGNIFAFIQKH